MGGHCGNHVVKYTCKSYSRIGGRGRVREWRQREERADTGGKESEREGDKERSRTEPDCA